MTTIAEIALLQHHRIFTTLAPMDAQALYQSGSTNLVPSGRVLFRQGDPADSLYLVLSGRFEVVGQTEDGEQHLAWILPGEIIGEMALVAAEARTATVIARESASVWCLPVQVFEGLLSQADPIGIAILKGVSREMCKRFRQVLKEGMRTSLRIQDLSAKSPR